MNRSRSRLFPWFLLCALAFGGGARAFAVAPGAGVPVGRMTVAQWDVYELTLAGPADGNPFAEVRLSAVFTSGAQMFEVAGFYDGDGVYRVRFMPPRPGRWHYETRSNRRLLTGKTGAFQVLPASGANHGPVGVRHTFHFAHADGTPFRPIGTTIYNWLYRPAAQQEETVQTLAASPFNKARMLVLPSNGSPCPPAVAFPFVGMAPKQWDFTRYDPAFFRNLEARVAQLRDVGVEADVILFHPYGQSWSFEAMTAAEEDAYVRYVVARLAAYRNVWWSLANEYDFLRTKTEPEWDRLFQVVQAADPYGHLRSIHNGARLYDNHKPWVTHASIQNGLATEEAGRAQLYRDAWNKPVVYDEVKYEGNTGPRWGRIPAQELVHRFWAGTVAGTYVGHSETLRGAAGTSWLSAGGALVGESPARIAFLRDVLEDGPADGIEPIDPWQDPTIGGQPGEYYLVYLGREAPTSWPFHLPCLGVAPGQRYRVEVLDPWAMTVTPVDGEFTVKPADSYTYVDAADRVVPLPGRAGLALRIRRVGEQMPEAGGQRPEAGSQRPEDGRRKTEDGIRRTEDGRRKSEAGSRVGEYPDIIPGVSGHYSGVSGHYPASCHRLDTYNCSHRHRGVLRLTSDLRPLTSDLRHPTSDV
ncbi:DUF5060 domain-containing protein [Opitutus sp. ER46]|uniref:DUF5060 domain-containing protein n=1 Tax=Opitutus sp. ER46 TaxID=2161864 RepID=UPI001E34DD43|nr:DUF5060 domain-containing protein [Opitutus sp. ER46]